MHARITLTGAVKLAQLRIAANGVGPTNFTASRPFVGVPEPTTSRVTSSIRQAVAGVAHYLVPGNSPDAAMQTPASCLGPCLRLPTLCLFLGDFFNDFTLLTSDIIRASAPTAAA